MVTNDDWTPLIGLRRAFVHSMVRAAIAYVIWTACVWVAIPALNALIVMHWAIFAVVSLVMFIPGVAIGHAISRNLTDIAGMAAIPVTVIAIACALAAVILGVQTAESLRPLGYWQAIVTTLAAGAAATVWCIRTTVWDA